MATPETNAKAKLKRMVAEYAARKGAKVKIRSNAAGGVGFSTGIADMTLLWWPDKTVSAIHIDVEVKAKSNTPTAKQEFELKDTVANGGHGLVVWPDCPTDMAWFRDWLIAATVETEPTLKLNKVK